MGGWGFINPPPSTWKRVKRLYIKGDNKKFKHFSKTYCSAFWANLSLALNSTMNQNVKLINKPCRYFKAIIIADFWYKLVKFVGTDKSECTDI